MQARSMQHSWELESDVPQRCQNWSFYSWTWRVNSVVSVSLRTYSNNSRMCDSNDGAVRGLSRHVEVCGRSASTLAHAQSCRTIARLSG